MKATIDVTDKQEGQELKKGLEDPLVRALVRVMGILSELESARAKRRVLTYVIDRHWECSDKEEA